MKLILINVQVEFNLSDFDHFLICGEDWHDSVQQFENRSFQDICKKLSIPLQWILHTVVRPWQHVRQYWLPAGGHLSSVYKRGSGELKDSLYIVHLRVCKKCLLQLIVQLNMNINNVHIGFGFRLVFTNV